MAIIALLGALGLLVLLHLLSNAPHLDAEFRLVDSSAVELVRSDHAELQPQLRRALTQIDATGQRHLVVDTTLLLHSPRWLVSDAERDRQLAQHTALADLVRQPVIVLGFDDGREVAIRPEPRGVSGLGTMFWLMTTLAVVLYAVGAVAWLARRATGNLQYAVMAWLQSGNLMMIAIESLPGWGLPPLLVAIDPGLRTLCDVGTGAAILHGSLVHPHALRGGRMLAATGWLVGSAYVVVAVAIGLPGQWWWTQTLLIGFGVATLSMLTLSHRREPHPASLVLRRLCSAATGTLTLLTLAIAMADTHAQTQQLIASIGSVIWTVFLASVLLLLPFLARSPHVMREFALLAGMGTVVTSLDLLFITVLSLGPFAALTLALLTALLMYAGARQWIVQRLAGPGIVSVEQTFDSLYRAARAIQVAPQQSGDHVRRLLGELFEPVEIRTEQSRLPESTVAGNGSMLVVPLATLRGMADDEADALVLRYAHHGRRLFTLDDARLADRVLGQLVSAVNYDRAVELGRNEERARLAQDLHDDIGARLLTLMYKAPDPEMEEYIRHTLQDLKTLTRGLAVRDHLLSEAVVEWRADIAQRLAASGCDLSWGFHADRDVRLGVVHWSGLTRILRELVNNVVAHSGATHVDVLARYEDGDLRLSVGDDGHGRPPATWSAGLGVGGVRKRVKLLGGQVAWRERAPHGIECDVHIPRLGSGMN